MHGLLDDEIGVININIKIFLHDYFIPKHNRNFSGQFSHHFWKITKLISKYTFIILWNETGISIPLFLSACIMSKCTLSTQWTFFYCPIRLNEQTKFSVTFADINFYKQVACSIHFTVRLSWIESLHYPKKFIQYNVRSARNSHLEYFPFVIIKW